jgi:hypothetical protein
VEILAGDELCSRCRRRRLAEELTAAVPADGPAKPARRLRRREGAAVGSATD